MASYSRTSRVTVFRNYYESDRRKGTFAAVLFFQIAKTGDSTESKIPIKGDFPLSEIAVTLQQIKT